MKKRVILLFLLGIQLISYGQGSMRFGAKAGINVSTIIETSTHSDGLSRKSTTSPKASFHGGLTFEFLFSERISLQVEALYSAKGGKLIGGSNAIDNGEIVRNLNYISFPVFGKYYATPNLGIELGGEISILSSAKDDYGSSITNDILKKMRKHDFSIIGGLSYEFYNGLFFQGRYSLGLLDVSHLNNGGINYYKQKNGVFQFSVGYIF